jgi:hypothetical protein
VVGACTGAALGLGRAVRLVIHHAREEIQRVESARRTRITVAS